MPFKRVQLFPSFEIPMQNLTTLGTTQHGLAVGGIRHRPQRSDSDIPILNSGTAFHMPQYQAPILSHRCEPCPLCGTCHPQHRLSMTVHNSRCLQKRLIQLRQWSIDRIWRANFCRELFFEERIAARIASVEHQQRLRHVTVVDCYCQQRVPFTVRQAEQVIVIQFWIVTSIG